MKRAAIALLVLISAMAAHASSPIPDDLSLELTVASTTDPGLLPGTHAVLALDVAQHGPIPRDGRRFAIFTTWDIPPGDQQPYRLFELPESGCNFEEFEVDGSIVYGLTQSLSPIPQRVRCLVGLDVLPPAWGGYPLTFSVQALDPDDAYDPVSGNDYAALVVGYGDDAGPSPFFTPHIAPDNPTSADTIRWSAGWDGCGTLDEPTLTRWPDGLIEVRWPTWPKCGIPIGGSAGFNIGPLPPGRYVVHVAPCQGSASECIPLTPPPDVSLVVAGVPDASRVPMLGWPAQLLTCLTLVYVARRRMAARSRTERT